MCCLRGELSGAWRWNLARGSGAWVEAGSCWDEWLDGCVRLGWIGVRNLGVLGVGAGQFGGRGEWVVKLL